MKIRISQLQVTEKFEENCAKVLKVLDSSMEGEWAIFPEGMISGYYPEKSEYLSDLDPKLIEQFIGQIKEITIRKNITVIIGTAHFHNEEWYNTTFIVNKDIAYYDKVNLATLDRKVFKQGNIIKPFQIGDKKIGIQMCRDLVFPEQWKALKMLGAQIYFHINNAIKPTDVIRESLVISRAFENQTYVCSVNNVGGQRSMIVAPDGNIIWSTDPSKESVEVVELELGDEIKTYLNQSRIDLVKLVIQP